MLTERFREALVWAAELHADQRRKASPTPYLAHLLAVTAIVLENGGDEDEAIASLLHDAIEDAGGDQTRREIERRFGTSVRRIVDGCTDADTQPKPPWRQRKESHVRHLAKAGTSVRLVMAADKLHNARSILSDHRQLGPAIWDRFNATRDEVLWYYESIHAVLAAAPEAPGVVAELGESIQAMRSLG